MNDSFSKRGQLRVSVLATELGVSDLSRIVLPPVLFDPFQPPLPPDFPWFAHDSVAGESKCGGAK
jgi:hypothetical protein